MKQFLKIIFFSPKNKLFLPEVFTANGTHNNKQSRFYMYQNDISELISAI